MKTFYLNLDLNVESISICDEEYAEINTIDTNNREIEQLLIEKYEN